MPIIINRQSSTSLETFEDDRTSIDWKHFFTKKDCDNRRRAL